MTMDKPGLTDLPPELLLEIVAYLSTSSLISLKLANRHLFSTTPSPSQDWFKAASDCEKTAWERAVNERKERTGGRRKCVHCGILAQLPRFPSTAPLCHWHQARFMSSTIPKFVESSLKIRLLVLAREKQEPVGLIAFMLVRSWAGMREAVDVDATAVAILRWRAWSGFGVTWTRPTSVS
ncbi:hypothetical protein AC579_3211 [Pseudocercospora musae]|uniref:F-box domain-containing protein n=1 Tax=Pseudocercospora musae TaxID=113226 RepID=A0A139IRV5_9PEZI|nr:hypothetical protein AC579_3211 [Pseudocercospora musae]